MERCPSSRTHRICATRSTWPTRCFPRPVPTSSNSSTASPAASPPETRRKAIEYKINVLGFDLTHAQQRGFEAALAILTREAYRSKVRLTLNQWHADYGVKKKESSRGKIEASHFTRDQSLSVLQELAITRG